jgi:hypothetical protein
LLEAYLDNLYLISNTLRMRSGADVANVTAKALIDLGWVGVRSPTSGDI